jgi:arachidonate 15-lipoxygenase
MMVAGPDPTRLTRLDAVPEKFPITTEHLQSVPELAHETLESALAAGRVYWVDHAPMSALDNGQHPQAPKYMYSPMVAFAVPRSGGPVRAFAIQCGQDPA